MNSCYLVPLGIPTSIIVRRGAAIGDCVMASVVAEKLSQLGIPVTWQTVPAIQGIMRRCPYIARVEGPGGVPHVNLDGAREAEKDHSHLHFCETFMTAANLQLTHHGIDLGLAHNCRPVLCARPNEVATVKASLVSYPRPWIFICPRSNSWSVRQVPDGIWQVAASQMIGTKFWIGTHPAPPGIVDLRCRSEEGLVGILAAADLLVTVDTGPMHIAAAQRIPVVAILQSSSPERHLSDQRDWNMIWPNLDCLHCMEKTCPKNRWQPPCQNVPPELIAAAANQRANAYTDDKISCVIPTYRAPDYRLNHCLENILPQVDEIIVTREKAGVFPAGAMQHPKIRYVVKDAEHIGFGPNVNYGVRHTHHEWVVLLNDDCYMNPGSVEAMRRQAKPDTGMLSPLLRYPDGRIYVTCKIRGPGERGWGHIDHKRGESSFPNVTETEVACGCCLLMRRRAFYDAGGFDEDYFLYAEDDQLSMDVRRAGWRILYVPDATGIHEEGQSSVLIPERHNIMLRSNALFARKNAAYFEHNANRFPIGDFNYLKA